MSAGDINPSPTQAAVRPIPPRYWWLKRILVAAGIWLLALGLLRWWWGWEAERQLQAKIAEYRAAGQPVMIEDFARPPVPDEENAAKVYYQAHKALVEALPGKVTLSDGTQIGLNLQELLEHRELLASQPQVAQKLLEANAATLVLIHEARLCPDVDWGVRLTSPVINLLFPQLTPQHALVRLVCVDARYRHAQGDDEGAVETVRDALAIGRNTAELAPSLIPHLVRQAIDGMTARTIEALAPELLIGQPTASPPSGPLPASRDGVHALIADLLDEREFRASCLRATYGERMFVLDAMYGFIGGSLGLSSWAARTGTPTPTTSVDTPMRLIFGPLWTLDAAEALEYTTAVADAMQAPNYPAARSRLPPEIEPADRTAAGRIAHLPIHLMLPNYESAAQAHFRALAGRRMAAAALAIRLYEVDHGQRPATLGELAPSYLPAVPCDPFAADDREIGYVPDGAPPVLYSVNVDGVDDGGAFQLTPVGGIYRDVKDMPFFLNGDRPRSKSAPGASTQSLAPTTSPATSRHAFDDDQQIEQREGQDDQDDQE